MSKKYSFYYSGKYLLIVMLSMISGLAFSNFGGYFRQESEGAGSLLLTSANSDIRLVREDIEIVLDQRVQFQARFVLFNDSDKEQTIILAFPQFSYWNIPYSDSGYVPGNYHPLEEDFSINGEKTSFDNTRFSPRMNWYRNVQLFTRNEMKALLVNYAQYNEISPNMPVMIWKMKEVTFNSLDSLVLDISFTRPWFYNDEAWSFGIRTTGLKEFDYIFETATTWKNECIEDFSCTITFPEEAEKYLDFNRSDFHKVSKGQIQMKKQNWKPQSSENLHIDWLSKYLITSLYKYSLNYRDYSWHDASDGSKETAWCFDEKLLEKEKDPLLIKKINHPVDKKDDLIQEKPFDEPVPVNKIHFINGFAKNEETYITNSRVKTIELYINDQTYSIVLEDNPGRQSFDLPEVVDIGKGLSFKIIDYYEGTKYNDLCISEIDFEYLPDVIE